MADDKISVDIEARFDDAKRQAEEYASFLTNKIKGVVSSPGAAIGLAGIGAAQLGASSLKREADSIKGISKESIQRILFDYTPGAFALRGVRRRLEAVEDARAQTIEDIGEVPTTAATARNLFQQNLKFARDRAIGLNTTDQQLSNLVSAQLNEIYNAAFPAPKTGSKTYTTETNQIVSRFEFSTKKFDETVNKFLNFFGGGG